MSIVMVRINYIQMRMTSSHGHRGPCGSTLLSVQSSFWGSQRLSWVEHKALWKSPGDEMLWPPAHSNSKRNSTPRRVSRPEMDRETEMDPPASGKHQLTVSAGCILITVSEENLSQNRLAKLFLNSPPTEMETTNVYCLTWTWKEKETVEKHCPIVVACYPRGYNLRAVMLLARALGKGFSAALATFHIWDVWSAFKYI